MSCTKYKQYSLLIKSKGMITTKIWDYTNTIPITTRGSLGLNTKYRKQKKSFAKRHCFYST